MKLRIVTASAGTGKTTFLAKLLDEEVGKNSVRPEAILATTFTKQASAELLNRVRTRLLGSGKSAEAQALLTARIGTVNAVCGSLVTDFSFELGLSPELRVLDEAGSELALKRALASVVSEELSGKLQGYKDRFDRDFDWHYEVRRLIEAARANDLDETRFAESAKRSLASLDACLGEVASDGVVLDRQLMEAIDVATAAIAAGSDTKAGTKNYCKLLADLRSDLERGRLRWGNWAKLAKEVPNKASLEHAVAVQAAAAQHIRHPGLRAELHELIGLMFAVAGDGLRAYQEHKRDNGLIDFVDQEVLALKLLKREDVCAVLKHELDLVLVDEFQDTSPLQLAIFLRLAELAKQSVWVGDPKQAIYGFRGTDPKLMDAAIESLTSTTQDAGLVADALNAVRALASVETLSTSYRSRPSLVELTNAIFAQAFAKQQGMEEERTTIAAHRPELDELGPAASQWPLKFSEGDPAEARVDEVGAGSEARPVARVPHRPGKWRRAVRRYYSWAELLRRVFRVEIFTCPNCGGTRRLLAAIQDPDSIQRVLRAMGLPFDAPELAVARAPPDGGGGWLGA